MHHTEDSEQQDDFELEITDLPPEEARTMTSVLVELGLCFLSRVRFINVKVTWQGREDDPDGDDDCFFDVRISDLPANEIPDTSGKLAYLSKRFWSVRHNVHSY